MSEAMKELVRQTIAEIVARTPPEELLKGVPAEELRKGLSTKERLEGLTAEEVLRDLSPEVREALARQSKANRSSAKPQ